MSIRVAISGAKGRMGMEVVRAVTGAVDMELVGAVDAGDDLADMIVKARPDALVDFTVPGAAMGNIAHALLHNVVPIVGTTGLTAADRDEIDKMCAHSGTGALIAPNFALGAVLMMQFAKQAAPYFPDAEVIEMHHEKKVDSPSGTAVLTAELIAEGRAGAKPAPMPENTIEKFPGGRGATVTDVPVHSVRLPGFVASQMVIFGSPGQTLTIRHDSIDRSCFMPGVLLALRKAAQIGADAKLVYGLENLL